ncbi:MAG: 30S ribosomal protein S20 [Magnetococcales bacterium]|nr:30S ribosomal protein S20 [Magnetococcales bacterium]
MANIQSAMKRARQAIKHNARNRDAISRMRTYCKKVLQAVETGNAEQAREAFRQASSVIAVTARKGMIHRNQAARRISRLNAKVKTLVTAAS